jgi:transcriptional regulator with XRE-family HTH domain
MISARQVRAARALLGWSQGYLASVTGLSITTIGNHESGEMSPRHATMDIIRRCFEDSCIEFTDRDGVQSRDNAIKVYRGPDSYEKFFGDILKTVQAEGGEVVAVFQSSHLLAQTCGTRNNKMGFLEPIQNHAPIKCILPDVIETPNLTSSFQFRTVMKQHIGASSYFVYGNKHAIIRVESVSSCMFIVFDSFSAAHDYRVHFSALWDMAPPIFMEIKHQNQRVSI